MLSGPLDAEAVEAFLKEAHLLHSIEHPHILRIYDASIVDEVPYLVMDYAPGGTLRDRHPRGRPVPLPTIVSYVQQIAAALDFAHNHKLIHCDLKPENLLLNQRSAEAGAYLYIGWIAYQRKAYQAARTYGEKAVGLFRDLRFPGFGLESLCVLAYGLLALGESAQARQLFEEAHARSLESGDDGEVARALCGLARMALQEREHKKATGLFEESIARIQRLPIITTRYKHILACCLEGLAETDGLGGLSAWGSGGTAKERRIL